MKEWKKPELTLLSAHETKAGGTKMEADGPWVTLPDGDVIVPGSPENS